MHKSLGSNETHLGSHLDFQRTLRAEYDSVVAILQRHYDSKAQKMAACPQNTPAGFFAFVHKQFAENELGEPKGKIPNDLISLIENHSEVIESVVDLVREANDCSMSASEYTDKLMQIIMNPTLLKNTNEIGTVKLVTRAKDMLWLAYLVLYNRDREIANVFFQNGMQYLASAYSIRYRPNASGTEEDPIFSMAIPPGKRSREIKVVDLVRDGKLTEAGLDYVKRVAATARWARLIKLQMEEKRADGIPEQVIEYSREVTGQIEGALLSKPSWSIPLYAGPNTLDFDATLFGSSRSDETLVADYLRNYTSMTNDQASFFQTDLKQPGLMDKPIYQLLGEYHFASFGLSSTLIRVVQGKEDSFQYSAPQIAGLSYRTQYMWGPSRNVTFFDPRITSNLKNLHELTAELNEHVVVEHDSYHGRSMWFTDGRYGQFRQDTIELLNKLNEIGIDNAEFFTKVRDEVWDNDIQVIFGGCPEPEYLIAFMIKRYLQNPFFIWSSSIAEVTTKLGTKDRDTASRIESALRDLCSDVKYDEQPAPITAILQGRPTASDFLLFQVEERVLMSARLEEVARRVSHFLDRPLQEITATDIYNHYQLRWKISSIHEEHLPAILKWVAAPKSAFENYKILTAKDE